MADVTKIIGYPDGSFRHCSDESGCEDLEMEAIQFFQRTIFLNKNGVSNAYTKETINFPSVQEVYRDHQLQISKSKVNSQYYRRNKEKTPTNSSSSEW
jgi:hypothetical protein